MIAETLNSGGNKGGFRTEPGAHLVAQPIKSGGNDRHDESHENYIVSQAMSAKWAKGSSGPAGDEHHNLIVFDETQITSRHNRNNPKAGDPSHPLASGARPPTIAAPSLVVHTRIEMRPVVEKRMT